MLDAHKKLDGRYVSFSSINSGLKEIDVRHLLVLCELGEEYKSFCNDLEDLIQNRKNAVEDLYRVIRGDFSIHARRYKGFIEKHKHAIEVMNKYSCTSNLTVLSYDIDGVRYPRTPEPYFYQLLMEDIDNVDVVKKVAEKLYSLGFRTIHFDKSLNFSEYTFDYDLSPRMFDNNFSYMENMEVYPSYSKDPIVYGTTGSNYCMSLDHRKNHVNEICDYGREIYLNNLVFDASSIPDVLTPETTVDKILELANERNEECTYIRNSVDFGIGLQDLEEQYKRLNNIASRIDTASNKNDVVALMQQMGEILKRLHESEEEYQKLISTGYPEITPERIESEKKLYLHRRWLSSIDYD